MVQALSQTLAQRGHDVRVILPHYQDMTFHTPRYFSGSCRADWGIGEYAEFSIIQDTLKDVPYYFISHPYFTQREGIYGATSFAPYTDNNRRFSLYTHAVPALCRHLSWKPDIIHCHDWTAGLLPVLARYAFPDSSTVMTVHNLAFQGIFPRLDLHTFGLDPELLEYPREGINMLRLGLEHADWVTTVSPTYAEEVKTPEYGCQLDDVLRKRGNRFTGILNGVDYTEWDPGSDPLIPQQYSVDTLERKAASKQELQRLAGLEDQPEVPLVCMISRIAEQKGFVELLSNGTSALEEMLRQLPLQICIIGTGDARLERELQHLAEKYRNLSVMITFSNKLAHFGEAGADFFLMPSRYEPCGLNQIYSLRYGTVPIVRRTGGLADTVSDADTDPQGTGFVFEELTAEQIFETTARAAACYLDRQEEYIRIQKRGMVQDFSWNNSAQEYEAVYNQIRRQT